MPKRASTADVRRLSEAGAQLVEVLPPAAYEQEHLPGAVNVPLTDLCAKSVADADLDPARPTFVYCFDHECDLSARCGPTARCRRRTWRTVSTRPRSCS